MPTPSTALGQLQPFALPLTILPLAALGLGFSPSPALVLALLVTLLHQARRRGDDRPTSRRGPPALAAAAVALVPGWTLAYYKHVRSALQSSSHAVVVLVLLSTLLATIAVGIIGASEWIAARPLLRSTPVARLLLFPVLWTGSWAMLGRLSPLGRQAAWTPLNGLFFDSNTLLLPVLGPAAIDLTLAMTASLISSSLTRLGGTRCGVATSAVDASSLPRSLPRDLLQALDSDDTVRLDASHAPLLLGRESTADERSRLLPVFASEGDVGQLTHAHAPDGRYSSGDSDEPMAQGDDTSSHQVSGSSSIATSARNPSATRLSSNALLIAGALLFTLLALQPTVYPDPSPSVAPLDTHTPVSIACVLPPQAGADHGVSPLDRYLDESRRLVSSAKVLLWPESVISLGSRSEWDAMIAEVGALAARGGCWVAVGVVAPDGFGGGGKKNSLVMVGPDGGVVDEYHKQRRVPIAESFSIANHPQLPPTLTLALPAPHHVAKSSWSTPELEYKRPVHLTSIICNDLNFPDLLSSSRSSLTLVPSSTWSPAIGHSLLAQARARALETDAPLLLCDSGGDGRSAGVSGFVDRQGHVLHHQVGGGSFVVHASLDVSLGFGVRQSGTTFQRLSEGGVAGLLLAGWALAFLVERSHRLGWEAPNALARALSLGHWTVGMVGRAARHPREPVDAQTSQLV